LQFKIGLREAKVMLDPQSSKSRSFGFVAFPSKEVLPLPVFWFLMDLLHAQEAQKAIDGMNGEVLGRRPIRTGWAVRRSSTVSGASISGQSGSEEEVNGVINIFLQLFYKFFL
jgi:hypothetical protein